MFGTFRDKIISDESSYKGYADIISEDDAKILDVKANLFGTPSKESIIYYSLVIPLYYFLMNEIRYLSKERRSTNVVALLGSTGPILIGLMISILSSKKD